MSVVFVQPSGINAQGGSSKIFRSLIAHAPFKVQILVYGTKAPPAGRVGVEERFVSERPALGRLERTRLHFLADLLRGPFLWSSKKRFYNTMNEWAPNHVHAHIHGIGFMHAAAWCRHREVPMSISIHDDIRHLASEDPWHDAIEKAAAQAWRAAANRFVISPEIGRVYSQRYGDQPWTLITDGLEIFESSPRAVVPRRLNVYFSGALNVPYEPNFIAMQHALQNWKTSHPDFEVRLIMRGGRHFRGEVSGAPVTEVRPFASPDVVRGDLEEVDLLYLPLSIDPRYSNFAKYSLSTKMVTYLASGLPILYHGPEESAAYRLLSQHKACAACFSNDPCELLQAMLEAHAHRESIVKNALQLGREEFQMGDIRKRFWSAIQDALSQRDIKITR